ncbi:MAG: exo-alpha-sialidase [Armatimonadetes bacterium]|nr:exo-alpha-sialidase [Armatimonadota bacterium]
MGRRADTIATGGFYRPTQVAAWLTVSIGFLLAVTSVAVAAQESRTEPCFAVGHEGEWLFAENKWRMGDGVLVQESPDRRGSAFLRAPAFSDFRLSVEFFIHPQGPGVRAAAIIFRATGTLTHYWLHLDSKNGNAILVRSTPGNRWIEIGRRPAPLRAGIWHRADVACIGSRIRVRLDGQPVLDFTDTALPAGYVGLGTSEGCVEFRNLCIRGRVVTMPPLKEERPPYKIISRGEAAGPYQAFPDACRLQNGDIMCVFYAGYGHTTLPNPEWPKGGRLCYVRSSDEGRTWSEPRILYDSEFDDRDPHIAQLADGTLICSFFPWAPTEGGDFLAVQVVRSYDNGETWEPQAETLLEGWACSAPVRQLPDGTCLLGVYYIPPGGQVAWGGVIRSTDGGKTWSEPVPIGDKAGLSLAAETDVIQLRDGRLFAALRGETVNMHYATSPDGGLTWSDVRDIGFPGHCPHLNRLSTGEILLAVRLPDTSLYVSRDEARTWQGPYILDHVIGAYPATVELKDGTVLAVYYEEGEGSAIRALRFRVVPGGIEFLPW